MTKNGRCNNRKDLDDDDEDDYDDLEDNDDRNDGNEDKETMKSKKGKSKGEKTDFLSITMKLISSVHYKIAIFIFIIGMVVFSDLFVHKILSKIDGATSVEENATTKGTIIQLMVLTMMYIVVDMLDQYNII